MCRNVLFGEVLFGFGESEFCIALMLPQQLEIPTASSRVRKRRDNRSVSIENDIGVYEVMAYGFGLPLLSPIKRSGQFCA